VEFAYASSRTKRLENYGRVREAVTSSYQHPLADQMSARSKRPPRQQPKRPTPIVREAIVEIKRWPFSPINRPAFVGVSNVRFRSPERNVGNFGHQARL
jgi:hypothetical protein